MELFNRILIALLAGLLAIGLLVVIIVVWADPQGGVERLGDLRSYLGARTDDTLARTLLSLGAAIGALLALMVLVLEAAPQGRDRIRLTNAKGGTTELSAHSLNRRLEADLRHLAGLRDVRAEVHAQAKGVAARLELWVDPEANLTATSDEACRLVKETVEERIGVRLAHSPTVYLRFAEPAPPASAPPPSGAAVPPEEPAERSST